MRVRFPQGPNLFLSLGRERKTFTKKKENLNAAGKEKTLAKKENGGARKRTEKNPANGSIPQKAEE